VGVVVFFRPAFDTHLARAFGADVFYREASPVSFDHVGYVLTAPDRAALSVLRRHEPAALALYRGASCRALCRQGGLATVPKVIANVRHDAAD
jgi:hypothetical protein